ncbi:valine--tRNA ligase [Buchnera aphidicola]|uniref:Valine--tRNA ligase n=1 Tax=Buchnera aphidicola (Therioaphis trifolii) TaxID=1241884 RepID=A0A4D6YN04_9GAMM|nr:valine--tRNA ligase [Buchnera aphidicola]QCI27238.1 valine--tRNA ligase [Buchnera aphidicola (Therioaphis trifolii)]
MENQYNPKNIEEKIYKFWEQNKYFQIKKHINNNFCIIMPPPNITGNLHMGHAFQQTIMDILIRYHRMKGFNTLWQMGVDHAGIATQILISKKIELQEKKDFRILGKKFFIKKCLKWKKKNDNNIYYQIKRLGSSVNWSRTRFTLDDISKKGVKKVFIDLYKQGLIYRKKKLCNWDKKLKTVISDLEIENRITKGNMWNIKYFIVDKLGKINKKQYLPISTTRPETLLGDTAVAVNPNDIRYNAFIGCIVLVPIINRLVPVIGDNVVDIKKGTGCVKITPAHDFNDYEIAVRNKLPMINIFTMDGKICNNCHIYDIHGNISTIYDKYMPCYLKGLKLNQARKKIIHILNKKKILHSVNKIDIFIPYGDRSGSKIEPLLTNQWYLCTKKLSNQAIQVVKKNKIIFFPKQYKNLYLSWMYNIQDWCISRQLWWGHSIPAWYDKLGNVYVGNNEKEIRKKYKISKTTEIIQDKDVLDTWFSSSLWSFLSLDWPKKNNLLKTFHPTNVLVSGFDIIFFWIARMIMMTLHCIKDNFGNSQIPFKHVYITGLIKDEIGQKMSKSKGNVLDPLDIIDGINLIDLIKKRTNNNIKNNIINEINNNTKKIFPNGIKGFGADALRFTFSSLSSITRNINWDMNRLQGYKNFCNKIWNASRFILINVKLEDYNNNLYKNNTLFFNIWISLELNNMLKLYKNAFKSYRFDIASNILYDFFWHKFCDWYLEIIKIVFKIGTLIEIKNYKFTLIYIFKKILKIAHPIIPFITEYIWKKMHNIFNFKSKTIMFQNFPKFNSNMNNQYVIKFMNWFQKIMLFLRKIRIILKNKNIILSLFIVNINEKYKKIILLNKNIIKKIGLLKNINFVDLNYKIPKNSMMKIIDENKIFVLINVKCYNNIKLNNFNKEIKDLNKKILSLKKILLNKTFLEKAPKEIIYQKQKKLKKLILNKKNYYNKDTIL